MHQENDMKNLINVLFCDDFSTNGVDKCVYTKFEKSECVIICLYVDAMLIFL